MSYKACGNMLKLDYSHCVMSFWMKWLKSYIQVMPNLFCSPGHFGKQSSQSGPPNIKVQWSVYQQMKKKWFINLWRATQNTFAGHMWPVGLAPLLYTKHSMYLLD